MRRLALPLALLIAVTDLAIRASTPVAKENSVVERDVAVPMRDGVVLRADVLRPRGATSFPVLVYRTPYGKANAQKEYKTFAKAVARGYAVVIQDVRGRYKSAGDFEAYRNEGQDGFDTIEGAAQQPWSNGVVGTFGLSYPAAVQWLAAMERPPHLKAMVPAMTFSTPRNFFYSGGVFDLSWPQWIWDNIAPDVRVRKSLRGPRNYKEASAAWAVERLRIERQLPLGSLPDFRESAPWYYEWLRHPPSDSWWDWAELRGKYDRVSAAVLNLSGWYDEDYGPEGATTNFTGLWRTRPDRADKAVKLLIGPWTHGVDETALTKSGEREFGASAAIDYDEVVLRWMDHYLKGVANGVEKEKPVRYFLMGANVWREADTWPPRTQPVTMFLTGSADAGAKGALVWKPPVQSEQSSRFVSDPSQPLEDPYAGKAGAHDYRALEGRSDALLFDSAPLARDLEVTGRITAEIFLSCDAPDMDLWVRLLDVAPDGTAFNLMSPGLDVLRASYRNPKRRELLEPGRIYELKLENLMTGNVFRKGHHVRVQVSAAFFPDFSLNLQTGELEMDSSKTRKAIITIYHDSAHASRIVMPVAAGPAVSPATLSAKPVERRDQ